MKTKKFIFVTSNQTKLGEAKKILSPLGIKIAGKNLKLTEIQSQSQKDVILHKATEAFRLTNSPLIVDDTAFYINGYYNFPGVLTKSVLSTLGINGLLKLIKEGQTGFFLCMLCYIDKNIHIISSGKFFGKLTKRVSPKVNTDTPLNSIFIPKGYDKPLIELSKENSPGNLHRILALKNLCFKLQYIWTKK